MGVLRRLGGSGEAEKGINDTATGEELWRSVYGYGGMRVLGCRRLRSLRLVRGVL